MGRREVATASPPRNLGGRAWGHRPRWRRTPPRERRRPARASAGSRGHRSHLGMEGVRLPALRPGSAARLFRGWGEGNAPEGSPALSPPTGRGLLESRSAHGAWPPGAAQLLLSPPAGTWQPWPLRPVFLLPGSSDFPSTCTFFCAF